jgi:hypothetical protein
MIAVRSWICVVVALSIVGAVSAQQIGECHEAQFLSVALTLQPGVQYDPQGVLQVVPIPNCTSRQTTEIAWTESVNLVYGAVQEGDIIIGDRFVFVDSAIRPDLDVPATLTFRNVGFAVQPEVLRDGQSCEDCSSSFSFEQQVVVVNVTGFSNYSLQGRKDFTVMGDPRPELLGKTYQVIDLGDARRSEQYSCVVMLFGKDSLGRFVLVQTNPERKVQSRLFGSPDANQPEALGYFPTVNGVANVYFRNDNIASYYDFEYVAMCQNNATQLVYEESIVPVRSPAERPIVSTVGWMKDNDGMNVVSVITYVILGIIVLFTLMRVFRVR